VKKNTCQYSLKFTLGQGKVLSGGCFSPVKSKVAVQSLSGMYICADGKMLAEFSILDLNSGKRLSEFW